jgi:hypothetical protein
MELFLSGMLSGWFDFDLNYKYEKSGTFFEDNCGGPSTGLLKGMVLIHLA